MESSVAIAELSPDKGLALLTTRFIHKGEVLFTERPLICCQLSWNRFYGYKSCDFCLQPLESAQENARRLLRDNTFNLPFVPGACDGHSSVQIFQCPSCGVEFCSETCLFASLKEYHPFICCRGYENPFFQLEQEWRESHLPPETGTVMLLVRIAAVHFSAHFHQCERAQHIVSALSRFVSSPVVELHNNDGNRQSSSTISLRHRMMGPTFSGNLTRLHALFLKVMEEMARRTGATTRDDVADVLQQVGLDSLLSEQGFCSALCLIGRNGQGIGTSSLGEWGKSAEKAVKERCDSSEIRKFSEYLDTLYEKLDETAGEYLDVEGVGLYELQSKCGIVR